ncbi:MAG: RagB/SusD family nutrient uptake outer membrane protein [Bacteroidaceae bacterium]|nr:RagB/SusD family nutrient uptake outer membrane protein [Bacteroidaceae bacterium]
MKVNYNFQWKKMIPAAALLLSLGLGSCVNDLDVEPIDPSTIMEADVEALYNKCFANMAVAGNGGANGDCDIDGLDGGTTGFVRQLWNANELPTDEAICCWGDEGIPAFNYNQWGASHPMLKGFYYRLYFGVTMCNYYLSEASEYNAQMTAEVRFLRAMYYYHLMDCFGNIPFMTQVSSEKAPQYTREQVYAFIESELNECEPDLAAPMATTYGRPDKAAAWMLYARLYLNAEVYTGTPQWNKAAEYAQKIMNSGYKLHTEGNDNWSAYQMLFMGDNGENGAQVEAILPLLQDGLQTTSWGTSLFLMASTFKADMTLVGSATNNTTEAWAGNRARPEFVAKFFPLNNAPNGTTAEMIEAAGDDRALLWGKDRTLNIEDVSDFAKGFSVTKFTNYYSTGASAHNSQFPDTDFFLMRAAEAWLTYAEATARANGGTVTAEGKQAIDDIRNRANTQIKSSYTLDDILDEWAREFFYEGRRRIDLIRYNRFGGNSDYQWQWKGGTMNGVNFSKDLNVFAIPDTELNTNPNLKQNAGY